METPHVIHLVVPVEQNGIRLDKGLAELRGSSFEESPQGEIFAEFEKGNVLVDGKAATCSDKLQIGQQIQVTLPQPEPLELIPESMEFEILFEDSDVIVVNKPAGLVVHPGAGHPTGTLVHGLLAHCSDLAGIFQPAVLCTWMTSWDCSSIGPVHQWRHCCCEKRQSS